METTPQPVIAPNAQDAKIAFFSTNFLIIAIRASIMHITPGIASPIEEMEYAASAVTSGSIVKSDTERQDAIIPNAAAFEYCSSVILSIKLELSEVFIIFFAMIPDLSLYYVCEIVIEHEPFSAVPTLIFKLGSTVSASELSYHRKPFIELLITFPSWK